MGPKTGGAAVVYDPAAVTTSSSVVAQPANPTAASTVNQILNFRIRLITISRTRKWYFRNHTPL
jgi:hypothetical protein